ncbi:hypothetical protein [Actinomadura formosensis]|uniref:hypothetical protein n=1 Tax=Actinomadura formosensis TaxID=60706 RepID=UPI003D919D13
MTSSLDSSGGPADHTAPDADAPLDDPLDVAIQRWAEVTVEIELHPLLIPAIGAGLHAVSQGPAVNPRMRELLIAESARLQQLAGALSPAPGPHAVPPVAVTVSWQVALAIVGVLQCISRAPDTPHDIGELVRTEGRRLQNLVCDDDQLRALVDTGWRQPAPSAARPKKTPPSTR